jgi:hypothetical protein
MNYIYYTIHILRGDFKFLFRYLFFGLDTYLTLVDNVLIYFGKGKSWLAGIIT